MMAVWARAIDERQQMRPPPSGAQYTTLEHPGSGLSIRVFRLLSVFEPLGRDARLPSDLSFDCVGGRGKGKADNRKALATLRLVGYGELIVQGGQTGCQRLARINPLAGSSQRGVKVIRGWDVDVSGTEEEQAGDGHLARGLLQCG